MGKWNKTNIERFIGEPEYDKDGQIIWGKSKKDGFQMLLDVRGWGAISHLFDTDQEVADFQDELGQFYTDAIKEKLERLRNEK